MSPVFFLMEAEVTQKMRSLIGWSHGNGIFAPGGSVSNLYGLIAARHHKFPETKEKGTLHLPQMVIFASTEVAGMQNTPDAVFISPPPSCCLPVSLLHQEDSCHHGSGNR